jgi:hypothetical protein
MPWKGDDFFNLLQVLSLDLMETYDRLKTDPAHQPSRRQWVRTFCSQVEAFAFSIKQMLADMADFPFVKLEAYEVLLLREQGYEIRDTGEPRVRGDKFVPIKTNLKFIARTCAKAFGVEVALDTNHAGWKALDDTFQIRNRLVHPKSFQDMFIRDEELKTVSAAQDWYQKTSLNIFKVISAGLRGTKD